MRIFQFFLISTNILIGQNVGFRLSVLSYFDRLLLSKYYNVPAFSSFLFRPYSNEKLMEGLSFQFFLISTWASTLPTEPVRLSVLSYFDRAYEVLYEAWENFQFFLISTGPAAAVTPHQVLSVLSYFDLREKIEPDSDISFSSFLFRHNVKLWYETDDYFQFFLISTSWKAAQNDRRETFSSFLFRLIIITTIISIEFLSVLSYFDEFLLQKWEKLLIFQFFLISTWFPLFPAQMWILSVLSYFDKG